MKYVFEIIVQKSLLTNIHRRNIMSPAVIIRVAIEIGKKIMEVINRNWGNK